MVLLLALVAGCGGGGAQGDAGTTEPAISGIADFSTPPHDRSFVTPLFEGGANCAPCHNGLTASDGADVSMVAAHDGTIHALAARDPFWQAKSASEIRRHPALKEALSSICVRCHMPMAHEEATGSGTPLTALFEPGGLLDPTHPLYAPAMEGVGCPLCHQLVETKETIGKPSTFSGAFAVDTGRGYVGPFVEPYPGEMAAKVRRGPAYGWFMERSDICAHCHNLQTHAEGVPDALFNEQSVFTEWEWGAAARLYSREDGKSCQQCHMPDAGPTRLDATDPLAPTRDRFATHRIVGGNVTMLSLMESNRAKLGIESESLGESVNATRENLQKGISFGMEGVGFDGATLTATVWTVNKAGHRFPAGFPSRRAFVTFTVTDAAGQVVFSSGEVDESGKIAGADADEDLSVYEPHYQLIDDPGKVIIYEDVMGDADGKVTYSLLSALRYLKDNRMDQRDLFVAVTPPLEAHPVGDALNDPDYTKGGGDRVAYRVSGLLPGSVYTVRARLRYQAVSYPFVRDLEKEGDDPYVARFLAMYRGAAKTETLGDVTVTVTAPVP